MRPRSIFALVAIVAFSGFMTFYGLQGFVGALLSLDLSGIVVTAAVVGIFGLVFLSKIADVVED